MLPIEFFDPIDQLQGLAETVIFVEGLTLCEVDVNDVERIVAVESKPLLVAWRMLGTQLLLRCIILMLLRLKDSSR